MTKKKSNKVRNIVLGITIPLVLILITFSTIFMTRQTIFISEAQKEGRIGEFGLLHDYTLTLAYLESSGINDEARLKFQSVGWSKTVYSSLYELQVFAPPDRICKANNKVMSSFVKCCQAYGWSGSCATNSGSVCCGSKTFFTDNLIIKVGEKEFFNNQNLQPDTYYETESFGVYLNEICFGIRECNTKITFSTTTEGGIKYEFLFVEGTNVTYPDKDGDGVRDNIDKCLNEKENYNGFEDGDGCPDTPQPDTKCSYEENEMLAEEIFSGGLTGQVKSIYSFRYPVVRFCYNHPILVADANTRTSETRTTPYSELSEHKTIIIPANQTWIFYYVVEVNDQIPVVCDVDKVLKNGTCQSPSLGIIQICSEGQFDASLGLCVVQPESKVICEAGRYDVVQNKCIYNPPIQAECPDGSIYNVNSDKCVYTPDLEAVCPEGTTFNSEKIVCEYTPDQVNVCLDGYIYSPSTNKCEKTPDSNILCQEGFIYNHDAGKCEAYPDNTIICQIGYTYEPETKKCIKYAETEILCQKDSAVFNSEKGYCVLNPPTEFVCEKGILSEDKLSCIYQPDFQIECLEGVYNSLVDKCVITPDSQLNCPLNYDYNQITGLCERTPDDKLICPQGTYNSEKDACIITPDIQYLCINGIYDADKKVCVIYPAETIYCRPNFVYDIVTDICVRYPDNKVRCLDDYEYNPNTDKCEKTPESFAKCSIGTYNSATDKCEYIPDAYAKCSSGTIFNPNTNKCEFVPDIFAKCPEGTGYNQETNKCEYIPSIHINCPPDTQYDSTLKKCVGTTHIIVCNDGYEYDPELHECVKIGAIAGISYWMWIIAGIILLSFIILIIFLIFKLKKKKGKRRG